MTPVFRETRRLLSSAVAIVLGVAFVAAALLLGDALNSTVKDAAAGVIGDSSVVVTASPGEVITASTVDAIRSAEGVTGVRTFALTSLMVSVDGHQDFYDVQNVPALSETTTLRSGRLPQAAGEVAANTIAADGRGLVVGSQLSVDDGRGDNGHGVATTLTVVGIIKAGPESSENPGAPMLFAPESFVLARSGGYAEALVDGPGPQTQLRDRVAALPQVSGHDLVTQTATEAVDERVSALTRGTASLTAVLLGFAAIALFTASLVISNTFGILVAQRTRQLALLRCVGATRAQVFGSVLGEALVLGVVASVAGVVVGLGLALAAIALSKGGALELTGLAPSAPSMVVPIVAGVVVTVIAALVPARQATRIAPLAALRTTSVADAARPGPLRLVAGSALLIVGLAALIVGAFLGLPGGPGGSAVSPHLAVGVLGGLLSFVGVLLLSGAIVPAIARLARPAFSRWGGIPGELACENAVRNPKRAAATASALLVGVTLITMMSVGAASMQSTVMTQLSARFPVDAVLYGSGSTPMGANVLAAARGTKEVAAAATVTTGSLQLTAPGAPAAPEDAQDVFGLDLADAGVARDPAFASGLADDTIMLPPDSPLASSATVAVTGDAGTATLKVVLAAKASHPVLVTRATLARLVGQPTQVLWVRFVDTAEPLSAATALGKAVAPVAPGVTVMSAAGDRAQLQGVLDTMLAIVVGLLGVAVVIALVGIGNTLSLSVLERTRESGLLRALGLSRSQLRRSVGLEALLLAGTAVALGLLLGFGYGTAGVFALIGESYPVVVDVPWLRLALVAAVALLAGWAASVLPSIRAARVSPAAALAEE